MRTYNGYFFDFESVAKELYRVTKPGGVVVWVVGDATVRGSETGTSFRQALYFKDHAGQTPEDVENGVLRGFNLHDTMIYRKGGMGASGSIYSYWQDFEYMFVLSKGRPSAFYPISDRVNKTPPRVRLDGGHRQANGTPKPSRVTVRKSTGRRFNIWEYHEKGTKTNHPAVFPEALANDHIISWSNEGDIVYDPFSGSGTTAKMAYLNNRKYIGSEVSAEYCEISKNRLEPYLTSPAIQFQLLA